MAETIQNNLTVQPKEKQKQGTGYTNIQRVLGANVGSQLGSTVRQGIQKQAQGVQQQTEQEKGQFQQDLSKGRLDTPESQQAREAAIERIRTGQGVSDQDVQQFAKFRAGEYGGPRQLSSEQELLSKAADVSSMARGLGTAEGRQGLLQQFVGRSPSYTAGKTAIDQLLLGRSAEDIKAARAAAMGLGRETFREVSGAREAGRAAEQSARAFAEETGQILGKETSALDAEIQRQMDEAAAAEERRKSTFTNIQDILSGKTSIKNKQGSIPGQQVVGGATRTIDPTELAIAELESSGLLSQEELDSIKGGYSSYSSIGNTVDEMLRKRAEKAISSGRNKKEKQIREALAGGSKSLREYYKDDPILQAVNVGSTDFGKQLNNLLMAKESQNLTKMGMVDPSEAAKFQALAKLAGKDALYQEISPEAMYKAGDINIENERLKNLANLQKQLVEGIKAEKYINPYAGRIQYSDEGIKAAEKAAKAAIAERERLAVIAKQLRGQM